MAEPITCECGSSGQERSERQRRESVSLTFLAVGCAHACCRPPDKPFPPTLFLEITKARLDLWGIVVLPRVTTGPQPGFEAAKLCQGGDGQEEEAASFQQKIGIKTRREKGFNNASPTWDLAFPGSDGKESACNAGDLGSISESGRCPE